MPDSVRCAARLRAFDSDARNATRSTISGSGGREPRGVIQVNEQRAGNPVGAKTKGKQI